MANPDGWTSDFKAGTSEFVVTALRKRVLEPVQRQFHKDCPGTDALQSQECSCQLVLAVCLHLLFNARQQQTLDETLKQSKLYCQGQSQGRMTRPNDNTEDTATRLWAGDLFRFPLAC